MKAEHYFRGFLNGWLAQNIPNTPYVEKIDQLEGKNLHVIGTCGECGKSRDCPVLLLMLIGGDNSRERLHKSFGCIDFEQKEVANDLA